MTGVRALAAYLVFFHHFTPSTAVIPQPVASLLMEGHIGVAIFYVLSGFLITYNYAEKAKASPPGFWPSYLTRRVARIYPLYLLLLAVTFLLPWFTTGQPAPDWLTLVMNVTLWKGNFTAYYFSGIPQAWSLTVEETFYFLAPLLFALTRRFGFAAIQGMLYAIGAALLFLGGRIQFYGFFGDYQFVILYTFFGRSFEFVAGMALARYVLAAPGRLERRKLPLLTYVGLAGVVLTLFGLAAVRTGGLKFGLFHPIGMVLNNLVLPLFICALFLGLLAGPTLPGRILGSAPAVFLGRASYAFYLVHLGVIQDLAIHHLTNDVWLPLRLFIAMNIAAAALFLLVEHPCNLWVRGWTARWTHPVR